MGRISTTFGACLVGSIILLGELLGAARWLHCDGAAEEHGAAEGQRLHSGGSVRELQQRTAPVAAQQRSALAPGA